DIRRNNFPRNFEFIVTVTSPRERELRILAQWSGLTLRSAEIALDLVTDRQTAQELDDLFNRHFVQSWHGKQTTRRVHNGTYTGKDYRNDEGVKRRPGRRYVWYADSESKRTRGPHCFHIETRCVGASALRQVGIQSIGDLLTFDH